MKAHKYWSVGALITMIGTFYTGYKGLKAAHKYFAFGSLICMIMAVYSCLLYTSPSPRDGLLYRMPSSA